MSNNVVNSFTDLFSVDDAGEVPDAVPISPPDKNKKIRTWGPSSVHQRDREKSRRVKARDRFMAERCNSVPNLGTQVNQHAGKNRKDVLCTLGPWFLIICGLLCQYSREL